MEAENSKQYYKKGLWTEEEDRVLVEHIRVHGIGQWNRIPSVTGLRRRGKSCRLRWLNYLSPNVKRGSFSEDEEDLLIRLHKLLGNRWSLIAGRIPGRTDNQVKNHWNTHIRKKLIAMNKNNNKYQYSTGVTSGQSQTNQNMEVMVQNYKNNPWNINTDHDDQAIGFSAEKHDQGPRYKQSKAKSPLMIRSTSTSDEVSDILSDNEDLWSF